MPIEQVETDKIVGAIKAMAALAEVIRDLGEVPDGVLYAQVMSVMSLTAYNAAIAAIMRTGLVVRSGNVLRWQAPQPAPQPASA